MANNESLGIDPNRSGETRPRQYLALGLVAMSISVAGSFADQTGLEQSVSAIPPHCVSDVEHLLAERGQSQTAITADKQLEDSRSADPTAIDRVMSKGIMNQLVELGPKVPEFFSLEQQQQLTLDSSGLTVNFFSNEHLLLDNEVLDLAQRIPFDHSQEFSGIMSQYKIDCHRLSFIEERAHAESEIDMRVIVDDSHNGTAGLVLPNFGGITPLRNPTLFFITENPAEIEFDMLAHELAHITEVVDGNRYLRRFKEIENWANEVEEVAANQDIAPGSMFK